jgi:hypothetical protein
MLVQAQRLEELVTLQSFYCTTSIFPIFQYYVAYSNQSLLITFSAFNVYLCPCVCVLCHRGIVS